jgi:CubicO group peptidase (beta-lactamase class C family)
MRDGSDYSEIYPDFTTTFRLQDCAIGWTDADYCPEDGPKGGYAFFPTIPRNEEKAGKFSYRSGSTDVMGWVLEAATGQPLAELISRHVWKPMGAEFDANITVDSSGFPLADHGVSATLRDLGRMGLLILNKGLADGRRVVPADFIVDMLTHPGDAEWPYGQIEGVEQYYRSFWWGSIGEVRALSGFGIHGQTIRVVPEYGTVVVIFSTWPLADGKPGKDLWWELDDIALGLESRFRE